MKASELIGKMAIRLKPYNGDKSFMDSPTKIIATAYHDGKNGIVYEDTSEVFYLPGYDDNHWAEHDPEMDKYPWVMVNKESDCPDCGECKYRTQMSIPCKWCRGRAISSRNYFQLESEYPYIVVPDDYKYDCEICKYSEVSFNALPCCDCNVHGNSDRCYFRLVDNETIIRKAIEEIEMAREDLEHITKIIGSALGIKQDNE